MNGHTHVQQSIWLKETVLGYNHPQKVYCKDTEIIYIVKTLMYIVHTYVACILQHSIRISLAVLGPRLHKILLTNLPTKYILQQLDASACMHAYMNT